MKRLYIPHGTLLRCNQGLKLNTVNVTKQSSVYVDKHRPAATYMDKSFDNLNCMYIGTAGAAMASICVMAIMPTVIMAAGTAGALIGGIMGGTSGLMEGANKSAGPSTLVGESVGQSAGSAIGGVIGSVGGQIEGTIKGIKTGNAQEGIAGSVQGMVTGQVKGAEVGASAGKTAGTLWGKASNIVKGTVDGIASGIKRGFGAGTGLSLLPSSFIGTYLVNRIPCICALITKPTWNNHHKTVRIEKKYALLQYSTLKCTLPGGEISIFIFAKPALTMGAALCSQMVYTDSTKDAKEDPLVKKMMEKYGLEIDEVPQSELPDELQIDEYGINPMNDPKSGFYAKVYSVNNGMETTYVLTFRGTETMQDWGENVKQSTGMESEQFNKTSQSSIIFEEHPYENIAISGHSKAGGQAILGGAATNADTYAFNPEGVHENTFINAGLKEINTENIKSYHTEGKDILSAIQDEWSMIEGIPFIGPFVKAAKVLPQASGERIGLNTVTIPFPKSLIHGHMMEYVVKMLDSDLQTSPSGNVFAKTM